MLYRRDIDGLRAIAVGAVVINHALPDFLPGGFVGVDIFFVLSGFLITRILAGELDGKRFSLLVFYERRARRILPALFALILVWAAIGWAMFPPDVYHAFGKSAVTTILFASNLWFWHATGDYFALGSQMEPLLHTWSLGVEEQFYLIFPLLLAALWRFPGSRVKVLWALVFASFFLSVWGAGTPVSVAAAPVWTFFWLPARAWELGLGALLALGALGAPRTCRAANLAGWGGLAAVLASTALLTEASPFPGLGALPVCLGTVALLWAGGETGRGATVSRGLGMPLLVGIGLISYSLYLWHWPLLVLARLYSVSVIVPAPLALASVLFAALAAWASWRWIETPFRDRRRFSQGRVFLFSAGGGGVLIGIGLALHMAQGVGERIPAGIKEVYARVFDGDEFAIDCMNAAKQGEECWIGTTKEPLWSDLVVWGDSHGMSVLPGLDTWLSDRSLSARALVNEGCPPLPGIVRQGTAREIADCMALNEQMLQWLEESAPKIVVLVSRWRIVRSSRRTPGESGKPMLFRAKHPELSDLGQAEVFDRLLDDLLIRLGKAGHQIVIVENVPEIGAHVPQAMVVADLWGRTLKSPLTTADHLDRTAEIHQVLRDFSERHGIILRDPAQLLCQERCAIRHGDDLLYKDDDHLSVAGAHLLVPWLMEPLESLISPESAGR